MIVCSYRDGHDYEGDLLVDLLTHTCDKKHSKEHTSRSHGAHKTDKHS